MTARASLRNQWQRMRAVTHFTAKTGGEGVF